MPQGQLSLFIPIKKIDEEQRLVYGQVAAEVKDNSGETFDYEGSKPYFEKWSANAHETSGGKSYGNVRVMHTAKVAGIVNSPLAFNDDEKTIEAVAKVVDDSEWEMVKAGGYTGFSMGGRYVERIKKGDENRYVADPVEISLVDKPCIPTATFSVVKADGVEEAHRFREDLYLSEEEVEKADKEPYGDVDYADPGYQEDGKKRYPIDTAAHIRAAWSYINKEKNAGEYSAKQLSSIKSKITAAWKKKIDKDGPPSAEAKKSDGDDHMYEPTNDEMLPVAKALAKAAGKSDETDWLEFMDQARADLIAKHDGGQAPAQEVSEVATEQVEAPAQADDPAAKADDAHDPKKCDVDNCDKCAAMKADDTSDKDGDDKGEGDDDNDDAGDGKEKKEEKANKGDESTAAVLQQGWLHKDGSFFARKADAVAYVRKQDGTDAEPTLADRLAKLNDVAKSIASGEAVIETAEEPGLRKTTLDAIEAPLAKLDSFVADPLIKGMYEVSRLSDIICSLQYLHSSVAAEAAWEGDNSTLPGAIFDSLTSLGETLVSMAEEEVKEMLALEAKNAGYPVIEVIELAAGTLGLEKSVLTEDLQKRAPAPVAPAGDAEMLAKIDAAEKRAADAVAKAEEATAELASVKPLVEELEKSLKIIMAAPQPKAPTTSHVVTKGDESKIGDANIPDFNGKTEQELSEMAIKLAQSRGVTIGFGGRMVPQQ